jgi:hypothetical protein
MGTIACTPLCLKAIGLELPHTTGSTIWQRLYIHHGASCLVTEPEPQLLPSALRPMEPQHRLLLARCKGRQGHRAPKRFHYGQCNRFPYHFYRVVLSPPGLLLPCSTLQHLRLVLWLDLYDPLAYPPIFHFLCSDPAPHPLTKQLLWRTHRHWTLACQWPNHTLLMEETACGCGVRVTVGF